MARCLRPVIASKNCATSSGLKTTGSFFCFLGETTPSSDPLLAEGDTVEEPQGGNGLVVIAPGDVLLLDE